MNPLKSVALWTRRRLKKVPLPWSVPEGHSHSVRDILAEQSAPPPPWYHSRREIAKLDMIIRAKFNGMYGGRTSLKTAEMKEWGAFLTERGISWEIKLPKRPDWEGWEVKDGEGCYIVRLKGLNDHVRVNQYFVPKDLAIKMLVLGELA